MIVNLGVTSDSENVINKTITGVVSIDVLFPVDVDFNNPNLILSGVVGLTGFNYLSMPDLNRHYFIKNFECIGKDVWRLTCSTDLLETFKNNILNSEYNYLGEIKAGDYGVVQASNSADHFEKFDSSTSVEMGNSYVISTMFVSTGV